jgi:peptidyl-prolyl cis-trans isomerase A (cyclophilin A)
METEAGIIEVRIDSASAPITATNFLRYVDASLYEGGTFYRVVRANNQPDDSIKIEVIQGGMDPERQDRAFDAIRLEGTDSTGLRHLDGTISMARAGPHTARSSFFICIGDQPELDAGGRRNSDGFGFAAFGQVTSGMDVVRSIQAEPADGQLLVAPILIRSVSRVESN